MAYASRQPVTRQIRPPPPIYATVPGDTLYSVSKRVYHNGEYWKVILQANLDVRPRLNALRPIPAGTVLRVPDIYGGALGGAI